MREDMDKVIVERPRVGSRLPSRKKGYRKYIAQASWEQLPQREPLLGRWRGRQRFLNEHLGPMRRFLRSRVGRPWNKVHQELCEHVSFDNSVQKHVLTHVFDFVQQFVELRDGVVFACHGYRRGRTLSPGQMYVCPRSGLLKIVRQSKRRAPPQRVQIDPFTQLHWRENAWWEVRLRPRPVEYADCWDVWIERPAGQITERELAAAYGGKLLAVSKRPLGREESRKLRRASGQLHSQERGA